MKLPLYKVAKKHIVVAILARMIKNLFHPNVNLLTVKPSTMESETLQTKEQDSVNLSKFAIISIKPMTLWRINVSFN
jgi:DNA-binding protein